MQQHPIAFLHLRPDIDHVVGGAHVHRIGQHHLKRHLVGHELQSAGMHGDVIGERAAVRRGHDAHTRLPMPDLGADRLDHAGRLLTADEGRGSSPARQAVALHDIAPTQARVFHLDQDVLGPWLWLRGIPESEVVDLAVVVDEDRLQGILPA